jgi:pfkB family carbohydrate kinase
VRRVGIVGALVWDIIHGRDPAGPPVEEWGGIAYSLSSLDATLPDGWEIVPLIKVGRDLSGRAAEFLQGLKRLAPGARCVEVPVPNNRVVLRYQSAERRCERMEGGVPSWTWPELGPMVADLDALYINFISGFELCLGTAQALRQGFTGPIYADMHSLFLGMQHDGIRVLRPLVEATEWFRCFDVVQMNEDEMRQLAEDPMGVAADALGAGVSLLVVTLGARGAAYVTAGQGVRRWEAGKRGIGEVNASGGAVRTELVAAPRVEVLDPTGCGDAFGAALCARLLAGDEVADAVAGANSVAARTAGFRGASGLSQYLRGQLVTS